MGISRTFTAEIGADAHGLFRYAKPGQAYTQSWGGREWHVAISKDVRRPRVYPAASDVWEASVTVTDLTAHA